MPSYRGLLEVMTEYVETRDQLAKLREECVLKSGREPEEVLDGMRRLFGMFGRPAVTRMERAAEEAYAAVYASEPPEWKVRKP